jgi:hypothetical protein
MIDVLCGGWRNPGFVVVAALRKTATMRGGCRILVAVIACQFLGFVMGCGADLWWLVLPESQV